MPLNNYLSVVRVKKRSLTPDGEGKRSRGSCERVGGLLSYSILANIYQTRLRSDCGALRVCL